MRLTSPGFTLAVTSAVLVWGCADGRQQLSPVSPSSVASPSVGTRASSSRVTPQRVDSDGDGYDDPEPAPDPGSTPPPTGGGPAPVQLTVSIVGTSGSTSFAPNPLQASAGNMITWTNNDLVTHIIVLDNGTQVGNLAPGQSSAPLAFGSETMNYRCTIHPSMVGQVAPPGGAGGVPSAPGTIPHQRRRHQTPMATATMTDTTITTTCSPPPERRHPAETRGRKPDPLVAQPRYFLTSFLTLAPLTSPM